MRGLEGEDRILEIMDLVKNPGQAKVAALNSEWPVGDPQQMGGRIDTGAQGLVRSTAFQVLVYMVGDGQMKAGDVEELLEVHRNPLMKIVDSWVLEGPGSLESDEIWDLLLRRLKSDVEDELWDRGTDIQGGIAVERFLRVRENRERVRTRAIAMLGQRADWAERVIGEIFMGEKFNGHNEEGEKAAVVVMTRLTQAYLKAIFDRKANEMWGALDDELGGAYLGQDAVAEMRRWRISRGTAGWDSLKMHWMPTER